MGQEISTGAIYNGVLDKIPNYLRQKQFPFGISRGRSSVTIEVPSKSTSYPGIDAIDIDTINITECGDHYLNVTVKNVCNHLPSTRIYWGTVEIECFLKEYYESYADKLRLAKMLVAIKNWLPCRIVMSVNVIKVIAHKTFEFDNRCWIISCKEENLFELLPSIGSTKFLSEIAGYMLPILSRNSAAIREYLNLELLPESSDTDQRVSLLDLVFRIINQGTELLLMKNSNL